MKNIISLIITLGISLLSIAFIMLILLKLLITPKFIENALNYTDYYKDASISIKENVNYLIVNEKLQNASNNIFTEERLNNDTIKVLNNKEDEITIKDELKINFKNALNNNEYQENDLDDLVNKVSSYYKKSLFPISEYKMIEDKINNKVNLNLIIIICFIGIIVLNLIAFVIKDFKSILVRSNYIVSLSFIFLFLFAKFSRLFNNFYYINSHFSNIIILLFNIIIHVLLLISLLLLLINLLSIKKLTK